MTMNLLLSLLLVVLISTVNATHFRFGTISWRIPDASQPTTVEFFSSFAFRRSFFGKPNVGSTINPGTFGFGDGSASVQLLLQISSIDLVNDWAAGTFTTTYTYPAGVSKNYTAIHTSAGRILELNNNPNQNWNVTCTVSILKYVNNSNGVQVLNTAPVSNNLPIVSAYSNEINNFRITAQDPEGHNLTYSLGSALDMGGKSLVLVPQLTVSSTGMVTFNTTGVADGYWCTQIKFSDGLCYSVVDFLIYIAPRPRVCDVTCSNKGTSCAADSTCVGCSPSVGSCVPAQPPYLVVPPTPVDGSSFSANVGDSLSYSWSAFTPNQNSNVTVTSSSLPQGSVLTTISVGNPTNQTLTWIPKLSDVGVYVVTLGCRDTSGQNCQGQVSFSINVLRPFCGYGTITPVNCNPSSKTCSCNCQSGFDPLLQCYDCASGYYGPLCTVCPPCVNGVCDGGTGGSGTCICNVGWQGANCSSPLNKPCDPTVTNYIMSNTSTGLYVNPSTTYAYMSSSSKSALSLTLKVNMPIVPNKLDVLLLVDVSKSITTPQFSFLLDTYAKTFFGNVRSLVTNSYFGVASFTDQPTGTGCSASDYPFRLHLPLSSDQSDFVAALTNYMKATTLGCDDTVSKNDAQLDALYLASAASAGWRADSFRVVVVITDSPFWEGAGYSAGSIYANRTDVLGALINANVLPIVLAPSTVTTVYNSLFTSLNFGLFGAISADYSNVLTVAYAQIQAMMKLLTTSVSQDTYGFVTSVTAKQSFTLPANKTSTVTLKYPSVSLDSIPNYPEIIVTAMGWGTATVVAQVNRAPVPAVCTISTREDIAADVPIYGSDADANALSVYVTSLPSAGYLSVNKSTAARIAVNTQYHIPDGNPYAYFLYTPNLHASGSDSFQYYLSDGCSKTQTITCSISVAFYDYPPVATSSNTNTTENIAATFTMVASDIETPASQLVFSITSLPDSSLGVLRRVSTGNPVVVNELFNPGENTVRFVPVTYACCDIALFTFQAMDGAGQTSNSATLGIYIIGVNQGPTPSASNVLVTRGVRTPITLSAYDPDKGDVEAFAITAYSSVGTGFSFTNAAGAAFPSATPFNTSVVPVDASGNAVATVYYTSPVDRTGSNAASITFTVMDLASNTSAPFTVSIAISSANSPPSANPAGPITLFQDSQSAVWNLNGTDADPADQNTLKVQITSLPGKGVLTQVGNGDISASASLPLTLTNPNVYYRTNQTGSDFFSFRVVDLLGTTSVQQVVRILITAVNHAPTATFNPASTPEDTPVTLQVSPYDQDGDTMSVVITSLTKGSLYQFNGAPITTFPATLTDSQFRFKFQGGLNEYGTPYANFTFYVDDNQGLSNSRSTSVTGVITVTFVNYPPTPLPFVLTISENAAPTNFVLNATDIETPNSVAAFLVSKPLASLGVIKDLSGNILDVRTLVAAPRTVQFWPNLYQYGTTTFTFGANDGNSDSTGAATATITVNHVNHAPSASATSPVTATRAVPLTITVTGRDFDINDNLTVAITAFTGAGSLKYGSTSITGPYTIPAVLNIPASNSRSLTLNYLAGALAPPGAAYDSFTFTVTDQGGLTSSPVTVSVSIAANNPPTANPAGPLSVYQDSVSAALPLNGTDLDVADYNGLSVVIVTLPTLGKLYQGSTQTAITSPGTLLSAGVSTVTYSTNQRGTDSFTFAVRDLLGSQSAPVTVSIPITNVNHAPLAYWVGTAVANEDTPLFITNIQVSDPDGDKVTVTIASGPSVGTLQQYDGSACAIPCVVADSSYRMKFVPAPDGNSVNGAPYASITFTATDGTNSSQLVNGDLYITPVNDAPVATDSQASTYESTNTIITLNATDTDTPMDKVTVTIQTIPNPALATITDTAGNLLSAGSVLPVALVKQVVLVPVQWANGNTTFSFFLNDGQLASGTATVSVQVIPVRDDPKCSVSPASVLVVSHGSTTDLQLEVTDPDQGETYTFYLVSYAIANGGALKVKNGATISSSTQAIASNVATQNMHGNVDLQYTVSAAESDTYMLIEFVVSDGTGNSTVCSLQFNSTTNAAPVADPVAPLTTLEEQRTSPITLNGTDDDYALLTVLIIDLPLHGVVSEVASGIQISKSQTALTYKTFTVYYTPSNLFHGADYFTFAVKDVGGAISAKSRVDVTVTHVNHNPSIFGSADVNTQEDTTVLITQVFASDPDGDSVDVYIKQAPLKGSFQQSDGTPISTYPAKLTSSNWDFKYVPVPDANGGPYTTFTVYAKDNYTNPGPAGVSTELTVNINVIAVNDPPTAVAVQVNVQEQTTATPVSFTLAATDVDSNDADVYATVLSLPAASLGTLTFPNGSAVAVGAVVTYPRTLQFTPNSYTYGSTSFFFTVHDENSYAAQSANVSIAVTHVNHPPTANSVTATAVRGVPLVITLTGTDPDLNDIFEFASTAVAPGVGGSFVASDGSSVASAGPMGPKVNNTASRIFSTTLNYTAPVTASGNAFATITFKIYDQANGESTSQTLTVDITPNSAPIAIPVYINATQDSPSAPVALTGTDADPADNNNLILVITTLPIEGVLIVNSTFNITKANTVLPAGTSVSYYTTHRGSDSFEYYVVDNLNTVSGTVLGEIGINPVNHPPTADFLGPAVGLEDTNLTINQITVSDPDGDVVKVYVTSVPSTGLLTQYDGTPINAASSTSPVLITDSHSWLVYVPAADKNGDPLASFTFYANDGQGKPNSKTDTINATISVTPVNDPPVAIAGVTSALENAPPITITLSVSDVDSDISNISVYLTSLPDPTIGTLYDLTTGQAVQILDKIPSRQVKLVLVQFANGNTSFSFFANDGLVDSSSSATQTVAIQSVNQAPTASAASPVDVQRTIPTAITIETFDDDFPEYFNYTVVSYSSLGGHFSYDGVNLEDAFPAPPFVIAANILRSLSGNTLVINYTAPSNAYGQNFAQITVQVSDSAGASSASTTVVVNVLPGVNPDAIPAGPITFLEESQSQIFNLSGSDADPADSSSLRIIISTLPTMATLYVQNNGSADTAITSPGVILSNPNVYLVGSSLQYGQDQFTFTVIDLVNQTSAPSIVQLQITHVNHPPTAGVSISNGTMNQKLSFNVFGQDPDNDIPLTIYLTSVPAVGTLYQGDGVTVISAATTTASSPTKVTDFNGKLIYSPPVNGYGFPIGQFSIYVDDNSGVNNSHSDPLTTSINIAQVALPPTAANFTFRMPQNSQLNFTLNITDPQGYPTIGTILTFPLFGNVYRPDGSEVSPASPNTGSDGKIIYVPPKKAFDNGAAPYATFTYRGYANASGLASNIATGTITVYKSFGAPIFTGATEYDIPDNTNLTMLLTGSSETGSYGIQILSTVASDRGVLFTKACMGSEGCSNIYVSGDTMPFPMDSPDMEYVLRYAPPAEKNGKAFANFTLIVTDSFGQSDPVTITINIYHINIPPVIVPWIYTTSGQTYNWSNAIVNIIEGQDAVIAWKVTDKDTPLANLTSLVYGLPYRGSLFYVVDSATGYIAGAPLTKSGSIVNSSTDGLFRVVYRPETGKSGQNYATFSLMGFDQIDQSTRIALKINVKHINLAPTVIVEIPEWNATTGSAIIVTGVSVNDSDASFYKEMFHLSLAQSDGTPAPAGTNLDLIGYSATSCARADNTTLNCNATLADLNQLLTQISVSLSVAGNYTLTVVANDLGAGSSDHSITQSLTATGFVSIIATTDPAVSTSSPGSNSVMTAVVAAAGGAGVAAAFGVWRYMKMKSPPTTDFFGADGVDSTVTNNPLFEENEAMSFSNALYESSN